MSALLRQLYEFRNLLGRRDIVPMPLENGELDRLADLDSRFSWQPGTSGKRRRFQRIGVQLAGQIKVGRSYAAVDIANVGGGGMVVSPAPPLGRGELTVVKITDTENHREYIFPAQVAWRNGEALGLSFFGIPIELRFNGNHGGAMPHAA